MKKFVIAALAIGAMAACTKSNVQFEQPGEISFQPVAQKATKAAVDGTFYPTDAAYNFNVWAWWGNEAAGTELNSFDETITPYIAKGTFAAKDNISWGGLTPYYWPTTGSLVFAGYSPASATGTFEYDIAANTLKITDYVQPNTISDAQDLMWFDVTDKSYDNNGTAGVPVTFKHALSWLTFKFNLKDASTAPMWTITDVQLVGIEDKASFTAEKSKTPIWTIATKSDEDKDVIDIYSGTAYTVAYVAEGTVLPETDESGTNVKTNAVLVIPQSCASGTPGTPGTPAVPADAELVITYNLKTYIGENNYLTGQTVTLPLNGTQITNDKWEPGKHYIYTITFGNNEILIAPEVTDWVDVPVDNIPVQ